MSVSFLLFLFVMHFKIAVSGMGLICFYHLSEAATFDVTLLGLQKNL